MTVNPDLGRRLEATETASPQPRDGVGFDCRDAGVLCAFAGLMLAMILSGAARSGRLDAWLHTSWSIAPRPSVLLAASPLVQAHVVAAVATVLGGLIILSLRKGDQRHRTTGWLVAAASAITIGTALCIYAQPGRFTPAHAGALLATGALPYALWAANRHKARLHRRLMGAMMIIVAVSGVLAFMPGRMMYDVVFGG
jgi:uncharacterized membrane protein